MSKVGKRCKKADARVKAPRLVGFRHIFAAFFRDGAIHAAVASAPLLVSAVVTGLTDAAAACAATAVTAVVLCVVLAVSAARCAVRASRGGASALLPEEDRGSLGPGTAALALISALSAACAIGGAAVFVSAMMITGAAASAACAVVFFSASLYLGSLSAAAAARHDPRAERRAFLRELVLLYTAGLLALVLFLFPASYIPLGDDFKTDSIPPAALLSLSLLYFAAAALRVCVFFLILRHRCGEDKISPRRGGKK